MIIDGHQPWPLPCTNSIFRLLFGHSFILDFVFLHFLVATMLPAMSVVVKSELIVKYSSKSLVTHAKKPIILSSNEHPRSERPFLVDGNLRLTNGTQNIFVSSLSACVLIGVSFLVTWMSSKKKKNEET